MSHNVRAVLTLRADFARDSRANGCLSGFRIATRGGISAVHPRRDRVVDRGNGRRKLVVYFVHRVLIGAATLGIQL